MYKRVAVSEIRDFLRSRSQKEAADAEEEDKKNDWRLAAAVIDRILSIVFFCLFIGGAVVFFTIFGVVWSNLTVTRQRTTG